MNDYNVLIKELREHAEWAEANIYEVPIMFPDYLKQAADAIEQAVEDLRISAGCTMCRNFENYKSCRNNCSWEWRGVTK